MPFCVPCVGFTKLERLLGRVDTKWAQDDAVMSSKSRGQWGPLFCSGWNIRCHTEQKRKLTVTKTSSGLVLHLHKDRKSASSLLFFFFFWGYFCRGNTVSGTWQQRLDFYHVAMAPKVWITSSLLRLTSYYFKIWLIKIDRCKFPCTPGSISIAQINFTCHQKPQWHRSDLYLIV